MQIQQFMLILLQRPAMRWTDSSRR